MDRNKTQFAENKQTVTPDTLSQDQKKTQIESSGGSMPEIDSRKVSMVSNATNVRFYFAITKRI